MAELGVTMVVGPLVAMVKEKASSYLLDQYKVMKGMEEQHKILKRKLPAILDVIAQAEQAASHREGVRAWLDEVKTVAYEANEVFDEFKYEALRRQAKKKGHYTKLGFDVIKLFPTHNRFIFRNRMGNKLRKIVQAIEVLVAEMNAFRFKYQLQASASKQWRQTDSIIVDPEDIVSRSRDKEKHEIVSRLIDPAYTANLMVLPIFGMGGLGKTTLAQLIYNHPDVQKYFQLQRWVCVSEDFDVCDLARKICQYPGEKDNEKALWKIRGELSGMRYLLVLDDVWNRDPDKWEKLKSCLQYGGAGSVVLVTTRSKEIAELMGTVVAHDVAVLDKEFLEKIIEKRAFGLHRSKSDPELLKMVGMFADRCVGSPLAAKALGSVLHTKTSREEWEAILQKSIICSEESGILPILKLSYDELPSHMKQCFAFCAIFPKDYEIDVDKLIQLWIANGFIQEQQKVHPETTGKRILDELASRSFFQDVKKVPIEEIERTGGCYSRTTCKIHDLMHDVALSIMEKECALATNQSSQIECDDATEEPSRTSQIECDDATEEPSRTQWLTDTARHVFLACKRPENILNSSLEKRSPAIQTLLCDDYMRGSLQHSSKYSSLQALRFYIWSISFPLKPKHLHHLRYLDLSRSWITALPEDISILYNLQTLNLSGCYRLRRLPRQMKYMTALRHLYTHGCLELKSMPPGLRKLTSLQTLTCFVVGTGSGCSNVGELKRLNLGGQLELCQIENMTEEDAKEANLGKKKDLIELTLKWTVGCEEDANVLDKLEPHGELQAIRIHSYGATTFPTWVALLGNMVEIHFFRCEKLQWFFSGATSFTFPNLKELTLAGMLCLERWWEIDNEGQGEEIIFPQLVKMFIIKCGKLIALPGQSAFPNLENVCIKECPKLETPSVAPKLNVLEMKGREEEMFLSLAGHMTSFTNLKLENFEDTETTCSGTAEQCLSQVVDRKKNWNHEFPLAVMELTGLKSGVTQLCACFVQLQELVIRMCNELVHWPEKEFQSLVSLRKLTIVSCNKLSGYAQAAPPEPSTSSETSCPLLPSLESLEILYCSSLVEVFNIPACLRSMSIDGCSKVESIFGRKLQQVPGAYASLKIESLNIWRCGSLTEALDLPLSLKSLDLLKCDGLRSLESHTGELPSLERLSIYECKNLSLPDGPQAYSSLQHVEIYGCPGIKTLPTCLQQRLGSLEGERLDARYEAPRKYIRCL